MIHEKLNDVRGRILKERNISNWKEKITCKLNTSWGVAAESALYKSTDSIDADLNWSSLPMESSDLTNFCTFSSAITLLQKKSINPSNLVVYPSSCISPTNISNYRTLLIAYLNHKASVIITILLNGQTRKDECNSSKFRNFSGYPSIIERISLENLGWKIISILDFTNLISFNFYQEK